MKFHSTTGGRGEGKDWLGRDVKSVLCVSQAEAHWRGAQLPGRDGPAMRDMVLSHGDKRARLKSVIRLSWGPQGLGVHAMLYSMDLGRVANLAGQPRAYERDKWGADALEIQLDPGATGERFSHFIFGPGGQVESYLGMSNRHLDGYHPPISARAWIDKAAGAWGLEATIGFDALGVRAEAGDVWGFNVMRVDADEEGGYAQWSPTFGEALRPAFFGRLTFLAPGDGGACGEAAGEEEIRHILAFRKAMRGEIHTHINQVSGAHALEQLGCADWQSWGARLLARSHPGPLRWDSAGPGPVPEEDRQPALKLAGAMVEKINTWDLEKPTVESLDLLRLECVADALRITGEEIYGKALEKAILAHDACWRTMLEKPGAPEGHLPSRLYPDIQVVYAGFLAYGYFALLRHGPVANKIHEAVMVRMLRAGRFADHEVSQGYNYGNHQTFESAGLAALAAVFPEFKESSRWAQTASLSLWRHFTQEVYGDGAYMERCGYHSVALSFTAQALAVIKASGQESRFEPFTGAHVMAALEKMYMWAASMRMPDGTIPPFGDFRKHSQRRMLEQGAALFGRPEWASDPGRLASVSHGESQFTVMRSHDGLAMAVDHGPMGGQHSHIDTMGFAAYAQGRAIATDSGMGLSYSDPNYMGWYRKPEAHNIVTVDDVAGEKVAWRTAWRKSPAGETLVMRSDAYRHARGLAWERTILFAYAGAWAIFDRLWRTDENKPAAHQVAWNLHLPMPVAVEEGGLVAADAKGKVAVRVTGSGVNGKADVAMRPCAVMPEEALGLRLHDAMVLYGSRVVEDAAHAAWQGKPDARGEAWFAAVIVPGGLLTDVLELGPGGAKVRVGGAEVAFGCGRLESGISDPGRSS